MTVPTLDYLDGFEHQVIIVGDSTSNLWNTVSNASQISVVAGRLGGSAIQLVEDGATFTSLRHDLPTSNQRVLAGWFKVPSNPSVDSDILRLSSSANAAMARIAVRASDGAARAAAGTGTMQTGPVVADGVWHRIALWLDTSGTTWTLKWEIDDVAQTDATQGSHVATDSIRLQLGSIINTHTATVVWDDICAGVTTAEHPLPSMHVAAAAPTGDGTHNAGTNTIENDAGGDIGGGNTAWTLVDEFPPNASDYIRQATINTGAYAEVLFGSVSGTIVDVVCFSALFSSATATDSAAMHIVDSTNDVTLYTTNHGVTTVRNLLSKVTRPAAGWDADFNTIKGRWGYASDVTPNPRITGWLLQAAVLDATIVTGAAAITGGGSVVSAGVRSTIGAGAVAGQGAISASGAHTGVGASAIAGQGAISSSGAHTGIGETAIAGAGAVESSGIRTRFGVAAIAGEGAVASSGTRQTFGADAIAGAGAVVSSGIREREGASAIAGNGSISASPDVSVTGESAIAGGGVVSSSGTRTRIGASAVAGAGSIVSAGVRTSIGVAQLLGQGQLQAMGILTALGATTIAGQGTVSASGDVMVPVPPYVGPTHAALGSGRRGAGVDTRRHAELGSQYP